MNATISENICHQLIGGIITGKIPPGKKLEEQTIAE